MLTAGWAHYGSPPMDHIPPPPTYLVGQARALNGPSTLLDAFEALADRSGPWLHAGTQVAPRVFSAAELLTSARCWRRAIQAAGVRRHDRVAILLPNDERFVAAFFGAMYAGATPVPLSWPVSGLDAARKLAALRPLVEVADVRLVVTDPCFADAWSRPVLTAPDTRPDGPDILPDPGDAAFLQFTSGSLGRPRGAVISHRAAMACVRSMGQAFALGESDVGLSWLPLFHDMGLVGGLCCPVVYGFPLHLMSPGEFLLHPARWLTRASTVRATIAAAPDFGWRMCTRRVSSFAGDLSAWRIGLDGAEPVHRATLAGFTERFAPHGFRADTLRPAYGLAENTLGVCIYDPTRPGDDQRVGPRTIPSVGGPLPGVEVRVVDASGSPAGEGVEGEILVRSGSTMDGYFRDEAATAAAFLDGWLRTGDLGLVHRGQLYVSGRAKELVIQNGAKFHPYDIERIAADAVDAALAGAAAFSVPGADGEALVVAVEASSGAVDGAERRIRGAVLEALGVRIDRVMLVPPGSLPRTTSGKVRRTEVARTLEVPDFA